MDTVGDYPPMNLSLTAEEARAETIRFLDRRDAARSAAAPVKPAAAPRARSPRAADPSALSSAASDEKLQAEWKASAALRAEFPTAAIYSAYARAVAAGKARVARAVCHRATAPAR